VRALKLPAGLAGRRDPLPRLPVRRTLRRRHVLRAPLRRRANVLAAARRRDLLRPQPGGPAVLTIRRPDPCPAELRCGLRLGEVRLDLLPVNAEPFLRRDVLERLLP